MIYNLKSDPFLSCFINNYYSARFQSHNTAEKNLRQKHVLFFITPLHTQTAKLIYSTRLTLFPFCATTTYYKLDNLAA